MGRYIRLPSVERQASVEFIKGGKLVISPTEAISFTPDACVISFLILIMIIIIMIRIILWT